MSKKPSLHFTSNSPGQSSDQRTVNAVRAINQPQFPLTTVSEYARITNDSDVGREDCKKAKVPGISLPLISNCYSRLRFSLHTIISELIRERGPYNEEADFAQLNLLLAEGRVCEAYFYCTLVNQGFCNWSKPLLFIEGRDTLKSTNTKTIDSVIKDHLYKHGGWLTRGKTPKADFHAYIQKRTSNECIIECGRFTHRLGNVDIQTSDPAAAGTYFHTIAFPQIFPRVAELLVTPPEGGGKMYCHLPGRQINPRLPLMTSTPDCTVSVIPVKSKYVRDEVGLVDRHLEHMAKVAEGNGVDSLISDTVRDIIGFNLVTEGGGENRKDRCSLFDPVDRTTVCDTDEATSDVKKDGSESNSSSTLAIMELKTFSKPDITQEDVHGVTRQKNEHDRKNALVKLLVKNLKGNNKMNEDIKLWRGRSNVYNQGNCFVPRDEMGMQSKGTVMYPLSSYPPLGLDPMLQIDELPWADVFPIQRRAVAMLLDIDSIENEVLVTEVFEDPPILLTPQCSFGMQMLEQVTVIPRKPVQCIFVGMFKAEKETFNCTADLPPDRRFRATNRPALVYAVSVEFHDRPIANMEKLVLAELRKRISDHSFVPQHTTLLESDLDVIEEFIRRNPHPTNRDPRLETHVWSGPTEYVNNGRPGGAESCESTGLGFDHTTNNIRPVHWKKTTEAEKTKKSEYFTSKTPVISISSNIATTPFKALMRREESSAITTGEKNSNNSSHKAQPPIFCLSELNQNVSFYTQQQRNRAKCIARDVRSTQAVPRAAQLSGHGLTHPPQVSPKRKTENVGSSIKRARETQHELEAAPVEEIDDPTLYNLCEDLGF